MHYKETIEKTSSEHYISINHYSSELLFCDVILHNRKIQSEEEKDDILCSYFAMYLLIPRQNFDKIVDSYGGLDEVSKDKNKIHQIAQIFQVTDNLIKCRIKDIIDDNNKDLDENNKVDDFIEILRKHFKEHPEEIDNALNKFSELEIPEVNEQKYVKK